MLKAYFLINRNNNISVNTILFYIELNMNITKLKKITKLVILWVVLLFFLQVIYEIFDISSILQNVKVFLNTLFYSFLLKIFSDIQHD